MDYKIKIITLYLLISSCASNKIHHLKEQYDVKWEMKNMVDSFEKKGIDTILTYYKGCHGCIDGLPTHGFVFYKQQGIIYQKILSNYYIFKDSPECFDARNLIEYFFKHENEIKNEQIIDSLYISNYHYIEITLYYQKEKYHIEVPEDNVLPNDDKQLINWIYRIESYIYNHNYILGIY